MISKDAEKIIKVHGVEPQKYLAWALADYANKAYVWGLCISTILFLCMLGPGISVSFHPFDGVKFSVSVGMSVFFFVVFLFCAVKVKNSVYDVDSLKETESGFFMIGMLRKADVSYVQKISEAKWQKIRNFDLEAFQKKQNAIANSKKPFVKKSVILKLERLKKIFKKVCLYSGILTVVCVIGAVFESNAMLVLICSFLLFSYSGIIWFIFHALIGLLKKEILVSGEWDDTVCTGTGAVVWGIVNLVGGVLIFLFLNFAIIYMLIYRFWHQ